MVQKKWTELDKWEYMSSYEIDLPHDREELWESPRSVFSSSQWNENISQWLKIAFRWKAQLINYLKKCNIESEQQTGYYFIIKCETSLRQDKLEKFCYNSEKRQLVSKLRDTEDRSRWSNVLTVKPEKGKKDRQKREYYVKLMKNYLTKYI